MKHARPPVKVQNERRMASFFVWMAWWCRAVLMHRTRWSFLGSLPQPLPKGKGFGAALTGIFFWESKRQRVKETKGQRDKESKRRGVKESKRRRDEESAQRLFDGFEQGLFNGRSMVVQWLFNGWCCFSWKAWQIFATAWQIFATAWQKIRMPCAEERQGRFCTRLSCFFLAFSSRCHQLGEEKGRCGVERCQ